MTATVYRIVETSPEARTELFNMPMYAALAPEGQLWERVAEEKE